MALSAQPASPTAPPPGSRLRRLLPIIGVLAVAGLLAGGIYAYRVFSAKPKAVAVTTAAGVAEFNFRVTAIPVPGMVPGLRASVQLDPNALGQTHGVVTADLTKLNTGLALRDQHAKEYLGVATHPTAKFQLDKLEGLTRIASGEHQKGFAVGTLTLNGTKHAVRAPIELDYTKAGAVDVTAHFDVTFQDYAISIPGADPKTDVSAKFQLPVTP